MKLQSEKKAILSLCSREISFGRDERGFPDRSKISSVLKRERISLGKEVKPLESFKRLTPLY